MFNFVNYFKTVIGLAKDQENENYDFNLKQFLLKVMLLVLFHVVVISNHVCMLLDEIFLFFYRFTTIDKPIMIIGLPRTGTTFLYRTLAEDREKFTYFTLVEILFAPSLIQKYLFYVVYRIDKLLGAPLKKCLLILEAKTKSGYDKIHPFGLFDPEEDELLLLHIYSTVVLKYFFPTSRVFDKYIGFDEKLTKWEKRNIFNFQKRCIKKHLFFWKSIQGKQKFYLSKNPIYSPKINSVYLHYPDVRLVITRRSVEEVIPSFVSMNASIIKGIHSTKLVYPNALMSRQVIVHWQRQLVEKIRDHNPSLSFDCRYEDLTANVKVIVCEIYRHFGIHMSEGYADQLTRKSVEQLHYRSDHTYNIHELKKALGRS